MVKIKQTSNDEIATMSKVGKEKLKEERENERTLKEKEKAARGAEKERIRVQKESARLEKELKRQQDEAEKVHKKKEREAVEAERELKKKEKELKRQQDEAEKEQRRKEKEAAEGEREQKRKERELKRQQDEAEKEQKRKERETAERKKQLVLQKQATIMDRLFRRKEPKTPTPQQQQPGVSGSSPSSIQKSNESSPGTTSHNHEITAHVDQELRATCDIDAKELLRIHLIGWQERRMNRAAEPFQRWGVRRTPKVTVFRELQLQGAGTAGCRKVTSSASLRNLKRSRDDFENLENLNLDVEKDDDCIIVSEDTYNDSRKKRCNRHWKLLQFDKSHRPAYYGTFSKKSATIGPRHPLKQDPSLDYEVDSDEEWEEEDPGESLSDCEDKEDEVDKIDAELDEDSADGFVVPDGYLSDNEGVHLDDVDMEDKQEAAKHKELGAIQEDSSTDTSLEQIVQKHERLMKLLDSVTKRALHRNRPFLVSNLMHQHGENETETQTERLCFKALRMRAMPPDLIIDQPTEFRQDVEEGDVKEEMKVKKTKNWNKKEGVDVKKEMKVKQGKNMKRKRQNVCPAGSPLTPSNYFQNQA